MASGHVTIKPYPKSKAGRRSVPIPPFAVQSIIEHERADRTDGQVLVFTTGTGEPIRPGTLRSRVWKPSLHGAGLPVALRFHDLRHSYATWLRSDGVPINDAAKAMRPEQTSTMLNRYIHSTAERDPPGVEVRCCLLAACGQRLTSYTSQGPSIEGP